MSSSEVLAECDRGVLSGQVDGGIAVFRNVPFAAPPVGDLRFEPPTDVDSWPGVRDASKNGPIPPQTRSRLGDIMGDFEAEQSEDCLSLTVWTPAVDEKRRPVFVWLHGGGYSSGAGSLPWYSGKHLAELGDIVVVSVNYRLGALGFLALPGVSGGNLGILDQIAALQWVQRNIDHFGGNPATVTLGGQSAGAISTLALMACPAAAGLFQRAILQSPVVDALAMSRERAEAIGAQFAEILKVSPTSRAELKAIPVRDVLAAQGQVARRNAEFANSMPPFAPFIDGTTIPGRVQDLLRTGAGAEIDLLLGTTREEAAAFCAIDPTIQTANESQVLGVFTRIFGAAAGAQYDDYRRRRPQANARAILADVLTDQQFLIKALRIADDRAAAGRAAHVYQFDWQSHSAMSLAACHCLELPFLLGAIEDWRSAPMLAGADIAEVLALGNVIQAAWLAFIRTGSPNCPELPAWDTYEPTRRTTMRFDTITGPVSDLAGLAYRLAWPAEVPA